MLMAKSRRIGWVFYLGCGLRGEGGSHILSFCTGSGAMGDKTGTSSWPHVLATYPGHMSWPSPGSPRERLREWLYLLIK